MGYVLSIFLNALQTWLYTKLWDSFSSDVLAEENSGHIGFYGLPLPQSS